MSVHQFKPSMLKFLPMKRVVVFVREPFNTQFNSTPYVEMEQDDPNLDMMILAALDKLMDGSDVEEIKIVMV